MWEEGHVIDRRKQKEKQGNMYRRKVVICSIPKNAREMFQNKRTDPRAGENAV